MHRMLTRVALAVTSCLALSAVALPAYALPSLDGFWSVTAFYDPNGVQGPSQCLHFNKNKDTDGFIQGTWFSPTLKIWRGDYSQKGQHFEYHGFFTSQGETEGTFAEGDFVNNNLAYVRSFASWQQHSLGGGVSTHGSGTEMMTRVSDCR